MGRRLYVGNLPYSATEDQLTELFGQAGKVDNVRVMRDMATGRARGFAFVEMVNDEDAAKAISQFHEQQMDGRALVVNEARPKPEGGFRGGGADLASEAVASVTGAGGGGGGGDYGGGGGKRSSLVREPRASQGEVESRVTQSAGPRYLPFPSDFVSALSKVCPQSRRGDNHARAVDALVSDGDRMIVVPPAFASERSMISCLAGVQVGRGLGDTDLDWR